MPTLSNDNMFLENRLKKVTYLTNHKASTRSPIEGEDGWTKCFYSKDPLGSEFIVVCDLNRTPITRQFAIRVEHKGLGLREVQVIGLRK